MLFVRYNRKLRQEFLGAAQLNSLQDGDTVLIFDGCTHHRQCGDIGTENLPNWIRRFAGKDVQFSFTAGNEFPEDVSKYALVVHCGGCMLNEREMQYRLRHSAERNVPMTNYGIAIAHMHGILDRALAPFPDLHQAWSSTANGYNMGRAENSAQEKTSKFLRMGFAYSSFCFRLRCETTPVQCK